MYCSNKEICSDENMNALNDHYTKVKLMTNEDYKKLQWDETNIKCNALLMKTFSEYKKVLEINLEILAYRLLLTDVNKREIIEKFLLQKNACAFVFSESTEEKKHGYCEVYAFFTIVKDLIEQINKCTIKKIEDVKVIDLVVCNFECNDLSNVKVETVIVNDNKSRITNIGNVKNLTVIDMDVLSDLNVSGQYENCHLTVLFDGNKKLDKDTEYIKKLKVIMQRFKSLTFAILLDKKRELSDLHTMDYKIVLKSAFIVCMNSYFALLDNMKCDYKFISKYCIYNIGEIDMKNDLMGNWTTETIQQFNDCYIKYNNRIVDELENSAELLPIYSCILNEDIKKLLIDVKNNGKEFLKNVNLNPLFPFFLNRKLDFIKELNMYINFSCNYYYDKKNEDILWLNSIALGSGDIKEFIHDESFFNECKEIAKKYKELHKSTMILNNSENKDINSNDDTLKEIINVYAIKKSSKIIIALNAVNLFVIEPELFNYIQNPIKKYEKLTNVYINIDNSLSDNSEIAINHLLKSVNDNCKITLVIKIKKNESNISDFGKTNYCRIIRSWREFIDTLNRDIKIVRYNQVVLFGDKMTLDESEQEIKEGEESQFEVKIANSENNIDKNKDNECNLKDNNDLDLLNNDKDKKDKSHFEEYWYFYIGVFLLGGGFILIYIQVNNSDYEIEGELLYNINETDNPNVYKTDDEANDKTDDKNIGETDNSNVSKIDDEADDETGDEDY